MTIHVLPIRRAFDRAAAEERSLFHVKVAVARGSRSAALRLALDRLLRSSNAAIAKEAETLFAAVKEAT